MGVPELTAAVRDCITCPAGVDASYPGWNPLVASGICFVVAAGLVIAAVLLKLRERPVPRWLGLVAAFAFGVFTSVGLSIPGSSDSPLALGSALFLLVLMPAMLAPARRFDLAGLILVGAGLPPLLWWTPFALWELATAGLDDERALLAWLAISGATVLLGLIGVLAGNRAPAPPPIPPPDQPDPGRAVSIATAMMRDLRFGPIDLPNGVAIGLGLVAAIVVSLVLGRAGVDGVVTAIVSLALLALLGTELFYHAWPPRLVRAMAAHAFVGSWEMRRFMATTGTRPPTSAAAAQRWLDAHPETDANRWVRPELLGWVGRFDEADEVLERLPEATEEQRFERRSLRVFLDLLAGRPADVDGLAEAAESIGAPGSDERMRAVAAAAIAESRRRLAFGEADWAAPLVEAQERIGPRSLGIQRADTWLLRFRMLAVSAGVLAIAGVLLGFISA
jgi:hypothetical protein